MSSECQEKVAGVAGSKGPLRKFARIKVTIGSLQEKSIGVRHDAYFGENMDPEDSFRWTSGSLSGRRIILINRQS